MIPFPTIGFTGTRQGMSAKQEVALLTLLTELQPLDLHHGDCIGSDATAHLLAQHLGLDIFIHPPDEIRYRAYCQGAVQVLPELPYLERNKEIVKSANVVIATPAQYEEVIRSGTWATIRYARKEGKNLYIILPDGMVQAERMKMFHFGTTLSRKR